MKVPYSKTERRPSEGNVDVSEFRDDLKDHLDDVLETGRRLVITRHGKALAAVIPLGDLRTLQASDASAGALLEAKAQRLELKPGKGLSVEDAILRSRESARKGASFDVRPETDLVITDIQMPALQDIAAKTADINADDAKVSIEILRKLLLDLVYVVQENDKRQDHMVSAMRNAAAQLREAGPLPSSSDVQVGSHEQALHTRS